MIGSQEVKTAVDFGGRHPRKAYKLIKPSSKWFSRHQQPELNSGGLDHPVKKGVNRPSISLSFGKSEKTFRLNT